MKSLLRFLLQYSVTLLFLALEVVALYLFFSRNRFQQSGILTTANAILGRLEKAEATCESYFFLRRENKLLLEENARLHELIANYIPADTTRQITVSTQADFVPANVIHWFHRSRQAYLTIDKGSLDSISVGMGVVSNMGIVGVTSAVTEHFSLVMPVISEDFKVNVLLKRQGYSGLLCWHGGSEHIADLEDVVQHVEVSVGDTVVTSSLSALFTEGINVGIVEEVQAIPTEAYYNIKVKLSTDYRRIRSVYVIKQPNMQERKQLEQ